MSRFFDDLVDRLSRHLHVRREPAAAPLEARAISICAYFPEEGKCLQAVFQIASRRKIASANTSRLADPAADANRRWLLSLTFYVDSETDAGAVRDRVHDVTQSLDGIMVDDSHRHPETLQAA